MPRAPEGISAAGTAILQIVDHLDIGSGVDVADVYSRAEDAVGRCGDLSAEVRRLADAGLIVIDGLDLRMVRGPSVEALVIPSSGVADELERVLSGVRAA